MLDHAKYANVFRNLFGIFDWRFRRITFPNEITETLNRHGFEVEEISGHYNIEKFFREQKEATNGIVLQRTSDWAYHYEIIKFADKENTIRIFVISQGKSEVLLNVKR